MNYFRIRRIFFSNADSQQYILIILMDLIISDIIFTRWSVTSKIFVRKYTNIRPSRDSHITKTMVYPIAMKTMYCIKYQKNPIITNISTSVLWRRMIRERFSPNSIYPDMIKIDNCTFNLTSIIGENIRNLSGTESIQWMTG